MIHIKGIFTKGGSGELVIADGTSAFSDAIERFESEHGPVISSSAEFTYSHKEFCDKVSNSLGIVCCEDAKAAVMQAVVETSGPEVIEMLVNPEDITKEFLEKKGYLVYADEESAVEALYEKICAEGVPSTTLHGQLAPDVRSKVDKLANKHGWLHVLNLLEA